MSFEKMKMAEKMVSIHKKSVQKEIIQKVSDLCKEIWDLTGDECYFVALNKGTLLQTGTRKAVTFIQQNSYILQALKEYCNNSGKKDPSSSKKRKSRNTRKDVKKRKRQNSKNMKDHTDSSVCNTGDSGYKSESTDSVQIRNEYSTKAQSVGNMSQNTDNGYQSLGNKFEATDNGYQSVDNMFMTVDNNYTFIDDACKLTYSMCKTGDYLCTTVDSGYRSVDNMCNIMDSTVNDYIHGLRYDALTCKTIGNSTTPSMSSAADSVEKAAHCIDKTEENNLPFLYGDIVSKDANESRFKYKTEESEDIVPFILEGDDAADESDQEDYTLMDYRFQNAPVEERITVTKANNFSYFYMDPVFKNKNMSY